MKMKEKTPRKNELKPQKKNGNIYNKIFVLYIANPNPFIL